MHWQQRSQRRTAYNEPGHAHELTFTCFRRHPFLGRERTCVWFLRETAPDWLPRIAVRRGERTEHRFWQAGGGYDRNITEARTLASMIEYVHHNPVRKGLLTDPVDWKWSSAGWLAGQRPNEL